MAEFPKECLQVYAAKSNMSTDVERQRLGCTHAEVGAYLMSIWGLPFPLVHAVAFHHHPAETTDTKFSTLTAVHAADAITSEADPSPLNHDVELDQPYLSRLGLSDRESAWRGLFKGEPVPSTSSH